MSGNIEMKIKKRMPFPVRENNCQTCNQPMSKIPDTLNLDCGGDCLSCMAWHGDPDTIKVVERLTGEKVDVCGHR
jgi:hypothetical protein